MYPFIYYISRRCGRGNNTQVSTAGAAMYKRRIHVYVHPRGVIYKLFVFPRHGGGTPTRRGSPGWNGAWGTRDGCMRAWTGGRGGMGWRTGHGTTHIRFFRFVSMGRHFAMASPVVSVNLLSPNLLRSSRGWFGPTMHTHTHTHTHIHTYIWRKMNG